MNKTIYMLYAICDMRRSRGRLIGVNTMIYSPSGASAGIGFAIPSDTGPAVYNLSRCRTAHTHVQHARRHRQHATAPASPHCVPMLQGMRAGFAGRRVGGGFSARGPRSGLCHHLAGAVRRVVNQLIRYGRALRPGLGIKWYAHAKRSSHGLHQPPAMGLLRMAARPCLGAHGDCIRRDLRAAPAFPTRRRRGWAALARSCLR